MEYCQFNETNVQFWCSEISNFNTCTNSDPSLTGSKIAWALKLSTSSNVHYVGGLGDVMPTYTFENVMSTCFFFIPFINVQTVYILGGG